MKICIIARSGPDIFVDEILTEQAEAIIRYILGEDLPGENGPHPTEPCEVIARGRVRASGGIRIRPYPGGDPTIGALYASSDFDIIEHPGGDWCKMSAWVTARPSLVTITPID